MKGFIWLAVGLAGGFLATKYLFSSNPCGSNNDVIKEGEESEDVLKLQQAINMLLGKKKIEETGVYDEATIKGATIIFEGTDATCCQDNTVKRQFVVDLNFLLNKLNNVS